MAILELDC